MMVELLESVWIVRNVSILMQHHRYARTFSLGFHLRDRVAILCNSVAILCISMISEKFYLWQISPTENAVSSAIQIQDHMYAADLMFGTYCLG